MSAVPRLHQIGPLDLPLEQYPAVAAAAVRGGADAVHVRMPGARSVELLCLARAVRGLIGSATLLVNDRIDVALVVEADGVQLGEHSFEVRDARALVGRDRLIGRSVHDRDGARVAADAGADFLLAGHVFDTASHRGTPGRGLDWLAGIAASVAIPVIAIGGITRERIPAVLATGAHGVALGRELLHAADPETTARAARAVIDAHQR